LTLPLSSFNAIIIAVIGCAKSANFDTRHLRPRRWNISEGGKPPIAGSAA
jgi:hypothetical protein